MTDDHCRYEDVSTAITADGGRRADEILTALADTRRRYVLYYLQDEKTASLTDIVERVAAWEHETSVDDISDESLEDLKIALSHNHLPKLRSASIVEYDERSAEVAYRDPPELVEQCLERCVNRDLRH